MNDQFRMIDTKRANGVYVIFEREEHFDNDASPLDWMDEREDAERIQAWRDGDWHFIGIRAKAHIEIVRNGVGTMHTMTSAGLWGIESDSGEEYFAEVYEQEKSALIADLESLCTLPHHVR